MSYSGLASKCICGVVALQGESQGSEMTAWGTLMSSKVASNASRLLMTSELSSRTPAEASWLSTWDRAGGKHGSNRVTLCQL